MLNKDDFLKVVDLTPLVAIDLVVSPDGNSMVMGQRINEPAAGYWFVPGGRIYKGETLAAAFQRITETELGKAHNIEDGRLLGSFTHLYDTNFARVAGISTHYVVLAYHLQLTVGLAELPVQQHLGYRLISPNHDLSEVHPNSLAYFPYLSSVNRP